MKKVRFCPRLSRGLTLSSYPVFSLLLIQLSLANFWHLNTLGFPCLTKKERSRDWLMGVWGAKPLKILSILLSILAKKSNSWFFHRGNTIKNLKKRGPGAKPSEKFYVGLSLFDEKGGVRPMRSDHNLWNFFVHTWM